ncbi:hypothetical protein AALO_G00046210 [Alosa alosa]|uniref:MBD domain-containing protein n=1 Tax=Alosa alosa TaxID=278164 RepID=A0AAV6HE68_9TELE|nr:methyl-CpG-binding domain protein 5-like isoform X1 [Alosa alosa]XP_048095781.1 methyl-CpG-binding domain protein 5-like isoform X1 [Alosa alosa]XP_048095782.1 methyl-CpG-binding domain protein 5-like isoform X1 [Alosa alosa]XP_048095783.1 methyl-CpG-binding domain protein 5-like isoform X1 [Alosa alosa]XP_048095784.1 methyl-CpG-binding domain protein 5-like isoform X1 [Alosa alosa]XP_048095785.1 methyl-CpG-binding domain protein 5-like isoform X1 [Alosa alosa]KAG5283792.1 hypothetical pro
MNTMKTLEGQDTQNSPPTTQVPIGWQRKVDHTRVVYISPSGSVLVCLEQVKNYLLTDGTCKCGLECPLILPKVFNFDPGAAVRQRTTEDVKGDGDVTKLCIHKRKIIAVATLHKSMKSPNPSFVLTSPSDTSSASFTHSLSNHQRDGSTRFQPEDSNRAYQTPVTLHGQKHFQHDMGSPPQQDVYSNYNRMKQGSSQHVDRKSPYRHRLSGLLSPSSAAGSHPYLDSSPSSRSDSLLSPDLSAGFQVTCSPGKTHTNSAPTTPLSPIRASHLSSPPSSQPSCAMVGRGNVPPAPSNAAKSPVMKPPSSCGYPQNMDMFHHKPQSVLHLNPHHSQLSSCVMAKPQVATEKDPLGILDPITSHSSLGANPSSLQTNAHTQVPPVNVNMHSTTVPLPSNLPLPTAKPGPTGHSSRGQYHTPLSVSPSPITSLVQMAASSLVRLDTQHHGTRSASSVSDHGEFVVPAGLQASFGLTKVPSPSPHSSLCSPYPIGSSSPSAKSEMLQNYKDHSSHFLGGMKSTLRKHSNPKYPRFGSSDGLQKSNQGVMGGMNHILNKRNSTNFAASHLLSAAAKAQTAHKNITSSGELEAGVPVGHHSMNAIADSLPPVVTEAQSGRAVLRDKLMAQQRDAVHKSRHLSNSNNTAFHMPKSQYSSSASRFLGSSEFVRKPPPQHGFKSSASMAQLLQNMSGTHNGTSQMEHYLGGSAQSPFRDGIVSTGAAFQSQQVLRCSQDGVNLSQCQIMEQHSLKEDRHSAMMNHYQPHAHAEHSWMGRDGQAAMGSQAPHKPHQQLPNHHYYPLNSPHIHRGTVFSSMIPNGYVQTLSGMSGAPHK